MYLSKQNNYLIYKFHKYYTMNIFENKGFHVVERFLEPETVKLLAYQFRMIRDVDHISNNIPFENTDFFSDRRCKTSYSKGHSVIFEALQLMVHDKLEKITNKKLLPTYSYGRIYYTGSDLTVHLDRPACEYSVTICIENDSANWPIYINDINGNTHEVIQKSGDAMIYKGCDLKHWRETFNGTEHLQCFLHFVDANGPNNEWIYDKRQALGL